MAQLPTDDVERIVRASRAANAQGHYAELEQIRQAGLQRHASDGVHVALIYQSGWYVHWAEGPPQPLKEMLERVDADPRHERPVVVHHSRGPRYLATRWSMMLGASAEPPERFGARVHELDAARHAGTQFPPTSAVRRLIAPLRVRGPRAADHLDAFHRVGICSADDGRCFDFVRWLAQRPHALGQVRRVAGEHDLDSASEYAEFLLEGQACRVIGVSRAGLQHGLRRAFLPDWACLVLLFGDDTRRNQGLMERVLEACQDLPETPVLLGAGLELSVHARMLVASRSAGLKYGQLGTIAPTDHLSLWQALAERLREAGTPASSRWDTTHPGWLW